MTRNTKAGMSMVAVLMLGAFAAANSAGASFGIGQGSDESAQATDSPSSELPPAAPGDTPDPSGRELTPDESLARDAEQYASDYGVTLEEAIQRLQWQARSPETFELLREAAESGLGSIWIEHEPDWRVVASYAGDDDEVYSRLQAIAAAAPMPVEVRRARLTELEVIAILEAAHAELNSMSGYGGIYSDARSDEIVVEVVAGSESAGDPLALERDLESRYGVEFRVVNGPVVPLAAVYGGRGLFRNVAGYPPECTNGFAVYDTASTLGIVTGRPLRG